MLHVSLLYVISLARFACVHTWALGRNAPMPRTVAPPAKGEVESWKLLTMVVSGESNGKCRRIRNFQTAQGGTGLTTPPGSQ